MKKIAPFNQNLFANNSDKVNFPISKTEKVKADFFSLENEAKRSITGRKAVSKEGKNYIQLLVVDQSVTPNVFFRAALYPNPKQPGTKQPDYTGSLDLHEMNEEKTTMRLSAWSREKEGGKAGTYLSIACQHPLTAEERAALKAKTPATPDGTAGLAPAGFDDLSDDIPF